MSIEIIRYNVNAGLEAEFEAAYGEARRYLDASPYCRGYELLRCEEEPLRYLMRIEWTSTLDHIGKFRRGPDFPAFLALVRPFIGMIEEMQHYRPTGLAWDGTAPSGHRRRSAQRIDHPAVGCDRDGVGRNAVEQVTGKSGS